MAKERLSKLQKWILVQTYKLEVLHDPMVVEVLRTQKNP